MRNMSLLVKATYQGFAVWAPRAPNNLPVSHAAQLVVLFFKLLHVNRMHIFGQSGHSDTLKASSCLFRVIVVQRLRRHLRKYVQSLLKLLESAHCYLNIVCLWNIDISLLKLKLRLQCNFFYPVFQMECSQALSLSDVYLGDIKCGTIQSINL